jgi:hypothetical protein
VFRRVGKRGLVRVETTNGDRVRSRALGAWLRAVGDGRATHIRVGIGPHGDELVPTADEAAAAERAAKEVRVCPGSRAGGQARTGIEGDDVSAYFVWGDHGSFS